MSKKLLTFIVSTSRPENIVELMLNLEQSIEDYQALSLAIYVDPWREDIKKIILSQKVSYEVIISSKESKEMTNFHYFGLHFAYEQMMLEARDSIYYATISDKARLATKGFDKILKKYITSFSDEIYFLKTTPNKNIKKYRKVHQAYTSPDNYQICSKRLLQILGGHEAHDSGIGVMHYYLEKHLKIKRDIAIDDINWQPIKFSHGNAARLEDIKRNHMIDLRTEIYLSLFSRVWMCENALIVKECIEALKKRNFNSDEDFCSYVCEVRKYNITRKLRSISIVLWDFITTSQTSYFEWISNSHCKNKNRFYKFIFLTCNFIRWNVIGFWRCFGDTEVKDFSYVSNRKDFVFRIFSPTNNILSKLYYKIFKEEN